MTRTRLSQILFIFAFCLMGGSPAWAGPLLEKCLGADEAAALEHELRGIVALETRAVLGDEVANSEIVLAYKRIQERPWPMKALKCIGFRPRVEKGANPDEVRRAKNTLIAALARIDESMWPQSIRKASSRILKSPLIRTLEFRRGDEHMSFGIKSKSAGVVQPLFRTISFSSPALARLPELEEHQVSRREGAHAIHFKTNLSQKPFQMCSSLSRAKGGTSTALHEYGHILDHAAERRLFTLALSYSQTSEDWLYLHSEAEITSPYGNRHRAEDFAESFSAFYLEPLFACYTPAKYKFFAAYAKANPAVYGDSLPYSKTVDCLDKNVQRLMELRRTWVREATLRCPSR